MKFSEKKKIFGLLSKKKLFKLASFDSPHQKKKEGKRNCTALLRQLQRHLEIFLSIPLWAQEPKGLYNYSDI